MRLTVIALFLSIVSPLLAAEPAGDLQPIFNGKDLTGWKAPEPNPWWSVKDGLLVGVNDEKKKGYVLHTEKSYKDVIVEVEFRFTGEIDSGVMLRKPEIQAQIGISRSLKTDMTAMFYTGGKTKYPNAAKYPKGVLKEGEWNTMRFEAKGNHFKTWLNGTPMDDLTDEHYKEAAPIGLQVHPGLEMKVEYRSVKVKELD